MTVRLPFTAPLTAILLLAAASISPVQVGSLPEGQQAAAHQAGAHRVGAHRVRAVASPDLRDAARSVRHAFPPRAGTLLPRRTLLLSARRGFGLSESGSDAASLAAGLATARSLHTHLAELNVYMAWSYRMPFPTAALDAVTAAGVLPSITWEPWNPADGVTQPAYSLSNIIRGRFDTYINSWARAAASFGRPLRLRFAHEMNGTWYPWGARVNGNTPAQYVAAYRHVHDLFDAAGARNVQWVWSVNVIDGMHTPMHLVYPGRAYVDSVGVDGYNGGTDDPSMGGWRGPSLVFATTLARLALVAPGKPVYVAEIGCAEGGGRKATWIRDLITYLQGTTVQSLDWFDFAGRPDWPLTSSAPAIRAARVGLGRWAATRR